MSKRILALDMGTISGFAHSNGVSGVWNFSKYARSKTQRDRRLQEFRDRLNGFLGETDILAYEEARCSRFAAALIVISEFQAIAKLWALDNKIKAVSYTATAIKKFACGHGHAKKEQMIEAAEKRWGKMLSSDHADSMWILEATKHQYG